MRQTWQTSCCNFFGAAQCISSPFPCKSHLLQKVSLQPCKSTLMRRYRSRSRSKASNHHFSIIQVWKMMNNQSLESQPSYSQHPGADPIEGAGSRGSDSGSYSRARIERVDSQQMTPTPRVLSVSSPASLPLAIGYVFFPRKSPVSSFSESGHELVLK